MDEAPANLDKEKRAGQAGVGAETGTEAECGAIDSPVADGAGSAANGVSAVCRLHVAGRSLITLPCSDFFVT